MVALRITKYNPQYRSSAGAYLRKEWISSSDVGRIFDDGLLTLDKYMATEDAYVQAVLLFFEKYNIKSLRITYLEARYQNDSPPGSEAQNKIWLQDVKLGCEYSVKDLETLIRLNLREACWAKLEGEQNAYLHFGYDYYMYVGAQSEGPPVDQIDFPSLVYVEEIESPYHHLDVDDDETE